MLNLYLISQTANQDWDTYDSAIVAAPDEETARRMHPDGDAQIPSDDESWGWVNDPAQVMVKLIGQAAPEMDKSVILASFNAG